MEDKTYGTLVTDCGIQLIAAAVMEGKKINITDLAVGDGGGSYYKPNSTMTALKGEKWRGKVNRVEINEKSPNMIDVVAVIPSDVGGWTIREMGVLDETETLIAVCNIKRGETKILKQILFNLVTQAEKQFGSGTGSLKYAAVADWIYQRIPAVLKLLFTSSDIEKMIEAALEEAKKAWGANENLKGYIETPSVESLLVGIEEQAVQTEPAEN